MTQPLQLLLASYGDPLRTAREAHAQGSPVIARIGLGIPDEIILAAGGFATALAPRLDQPTPLADAFMDPSEQPELRSLLEQIASSQSRFLSLAVLTAPYSALAATIEDLRRVALLPDAAPTSYMEFPAVRGDGARRYAEARVRDLASRIGSVTGQPVTTEALRRAIASTNRRREALRTFMAHRRDTAAISGIEAFGAVGAASFLPPAVFTDALDALTASLRSSDRLHGLPRILLVPSSPLTHDRAHAAIEAAGALVIAEDDPLGSRAAEPAIREDEDPMRAIADHYLDQLSGTRAFPADRRLAWFYEEAARPDVDAVIFYGQEPRYGWDHPAMRDFLDSRGTPSTFIRADARTADGFAQVEAAAIALLQTLPTRETGTTP